MSDIAERVLRHLYEAWQATVELTLARADLGAAVGWTHYPTRTAYLDYTLTFEEWLSTLEHEMTHLLHASEVAAERRAGGPAVGATVTTLVPSESPVGDGAGEEPAAVGTPAVDLREARRRLRAAPPASVDG